MPLGGRARAAPPVTCATASTGTHTLTPDVSLIIATRNRDALLRAMLGSLDVALATGGGTTEVLVVDNGSTDETAAILRRWSAAGVLRARLVVERPGKARALNAALRVARAPLLAFTDDDVELAPNWLDAVRRFFSEHAAYAAAIGPVRLPPHVTDPALLAQIALYSTLPLFDAGSRVRDDAHLYGCNMAVRRTAFERVGEFNEQLGPGASGLHEDGDLARRLVRAGMRIGYIPDAVVYHAVEPSRLTEEYFRTLHVRDARSRFVLEPQRRWAGALAHWLGAVVVLGRWSLTGNAPRRMRARGRLISHTEYLRLRWQQHQQRGG